MSWSRLGDMIGRRLFLEERRKLIAKAGRKLSKPVPKRHPPKLKNVAWNELNDPLDDLFRD